MIPKFLCNYCKMQFDSAEDCLDHETVCLSAPGENMVMVAEFHPGVFIEPLGPWEVVFSDTCLRECDRTILIHMPDVDECGTTPRWTTHCMNTDKDKFNAANRLRDAARKWFSAVSKAMGDLRVHDSTLPTAQEQALTDMLKDRWVK